MELLAHGLVENIFRCPHCHTVFRFLEEDLDKVRCEKYPLSLYRGLSKVLSVTCEECSQACVLVEEHLVPDYPSGFQRKIKRPNQLEIKA